MESEIYQHEYTNDFVRRWDNLIGWEGRAKGENGFFESILDQYNCKSVADIATGTGFHAIVLADQGYEVTATDGAEMMVEKTKENARQMDVTLKDAQCVDWRELDTTFGHNKFDSLLCLGNSFTHLFDEDDRRRALAAMMNVLKPGGVLVLDLLGLETLCRTLEPVHLTEYADGRLLVERPALVDHNTRLENEWILVRGDRADRATFSHRVWSAGEIARLVESAGLELEAIDGDLHGTPYDFESERMYVFARKP
jgi:SAM-dependent methyltransferase